MISEGTSSVLPQRMVWLPKCTQRRVYWSRMKLCHGRSVHIRVAAKQLTRDEIRRIRWCSLVLCKNGSTKCAYMSPMLCLWNQWWWALLYLVWGKSRQDRRWHFEDWSWKHFRPCWRNCSHATVQDSLDELVTIWGVTLPSLVLIRSNIWIALCAHLCMSLEYKYPSISRTLWT